MKKGFLTVAMATLLVSQGMLFSSCEKETVAQEATENRTENDAVVNPKTGGLSHFVARVVVIIGSKIKKGSNAVPVTGGTGTIASNPSLLPVCALSMYSYDHGVCVTDDGNFSSAPYDIMVDAALMTTDLGIVYAIDSTLNPNEANWIFSSDTLTFSYPITVNHPAILSDLGIASPITINGDYPVYRDGQYLFIIIQ